MENIKFDVLLFQTDSLAEAFNDEDANMIRINGLTKYETDTLVLILYKHKINVCLLPFVETEDQPF